MLTIGLFLDPEDLYSDEYPALVDEPWHESGRLRLERHDSEYRRPDRRYPGGCSDLFLRGLDLSRLVKDDRQQAAIYAKLLGSADRIRPVVLRHGLIAVVRHRRHRAEFGSLTGRLRRIAAEQENEPAQPHGHEGRDRFSGYVFELLRLHSDLA
jgi:hypothetical protein